MKKLTPKINSLYIHIPFCHDICPYCDFPKILLNNKITDKYLDCLIKELDSLKINHKLKTIYIGGGTPSCISLTPLLNKLDKYISKNTEFTLEGNVLDFSTSKLKEYKKHGINRISLGVQSLNDNILKVLGRKHTKTDAINKIKLIKKYIPNINVDLIYGFNELTNKILIDELKEYIKLNVNHISTYSLEINKGTKFYNDKKKMMDTTLIRKQFDIIYDYLSKHQFNRYEIANFAKRNYESKHNINYWLDNEYYGIGLGAASYINKVRRTNTRSITKYLEGKYIDYQEKISKDDDKKYYLMLNLRLTKGLSYKDYQKKFKSNLYTSKKEIIDKLVIRKLLKKNYTRLVTTYEGSMLLDIILRELF